MSKLSKWFSNNYKYLIAGLILVIPLYPKFHAISVPFTYVSVRLEDFLMLLAAVVLALLSVNEFRLYWRNSLEKSIFISLIIGFFSLASAIILTNTVIPSIGLLHWARRIEYFIPLFAGLYVIKQKNSSLIEFYMKLLLIVIFIAFVYGLGQKYFSWPVIITQNEEYSKGIALRWIPGSNLNSTFAGHYDLASYLVMVVPILVCWLVKVRGWTARIIIFLALFAGGWLLSNTLSRIASVATIMGSGIALFMLRKYKEIAILAIVGLVFLGLSGDLRARFQRIFDVIVKQVSAQEIVISPTPVPIPVFEDRSTSIRLNVEWPRAIRAFTKNPFLGTGYSSITLATDNDYLRLLGEVGILGFIAFSVILFKIGQLGLSVYKKLGKNLYNDTESVFLAGYFGGFVGFVTTAVFIDVFEASKVAITFWLFTGMAVGINRNNINEQNI
jgi:hypothetical protein